MCEKGFMVDYHKPNMNSCPFSAKLGIHHGRIGWTCGEILKDKIRNGRRGKYLRIIQDKIKDMQLALYAHVMKKLPKMPTRRCSYMQISV